MKMELDHKSEEEKSTIKREEISLTNGEEITSTNGEEIASTNEKEIASTNGEENATPNGVENATTNAEENATPNREENATPNGAEKSKRQIKREEKRRQWLDSKSERRKEERERRKRKMERMREEKTFTESRSASRKRVKKEQVKMVDSDCKVGVVFDMQFGNLMHQRDLGKCIKQILRCYSQNRRLLAPLQLHLSSLNGDVLQEMTKHDGYKAWDINYYDTNFFDNISKDSLVYLSGDSENVLETLDQNKNYIIGGLVDHNNHKGICLNKAKELGIQHARLPIDKCVEMKTRHILAVNHVYEIMVQVTLGKSWKEAFFHVIPGRKGLESKQQDIEDNESEESNDNQQSNEANDMDNDKNNVLDNDSSKINEELNHSAEQDKAEDNNTADNGLNNDADNVLNNESKEDNEHNLLVNEVS